MSSIGQSLLCHEIKLANELLLLSYPEPVQFIYNPMEYAIETHSDFICKFANGCPKPLMFLGMNPGKFVWRDLLVIWTKEGRNFHFPGPWGMAQTGKLYIPLFLPSILLYSKWKNQESTDQDTLFK